MSLKNRYDNVIIRNNLSLGLSHNALDYVLKLEKENENFKKQYCERTDCGGRLGNSKKVEELIKENENLKEKNTIYKSTIKGQYNKIKELQNAKRISKEVHKKRNKKLQEENEKLNHYKLLYQKVKERNDKAIDYIEKNKYVIREYTSANSGTKKIYEFCCEPDELLEILKGESNE